MTPFVTLVAQVEKSRTVEKTFNVTSSTLLSISNKYGDVHIDTWDKNVIELKVTITAEKRSESQAQAYLDKVDIDISESSSHIEVETEITGSINNRGGESLSIDYEVSMPKSNDLELKHAYGNLYLADLDGDITLKMSYGNMTVGTLGGEGNVKLSYGNGEIEGLNIGLLSIGYSNLSAEALGKVELTSQYSNVELSEIKDIELMNKYGKVEIDEIDNIRGSSRYGNIEIGRLNNSLILDLLHGNGVNVDWISKDFNRIEIDASYAGSSLRFERGFSAELEAYFKYSGLKYSEEDFDFAYVNKGTSTSEYKGRIGSGSSTSKIKLESSYGSIKIGYAR
ncbi:MAG: hypothetical protein HKN68_03980 [Saprospiraceae bacterium]|nr:hypothetical protein [Saprospiraceae bacterium]